MKSILALCLVALGAAAAWRYAHRAPPDISEARAKQLADEALLDFCQMEGPVGAVCPYFVSKGTQAPTDDRFRWAFPFLDTHAEPWKHVVISVGLKGEISTSYTNPPVDPALADPTLSAAPPEAPPSP